MQSYQRFQCIGHTDFKDLSSAVTNTPSLLPSMGKTGLGAIVCKTVHVRFRTRKRVHTRLSEKNRTQGHTRRNRVLPSLGHSAALCCQRNSFYSATLLYTYISRFFVNPQHQQKRKIRQSYHHKFYPPTAFQLLAQTAHVCFHRRKWVHTRLSEKDRTQRLTGRNRGLPDGAAITTLGLFHTLRKPCVARG